jgi:hypothetical protein
VAGVIKRRDVIVVRARLVVVSRVNRCGADSSVVFVVNRERERWRCGRGGARDARSRSR